MFGANQAECSRSWMRFCPQRAVVSMAFYSGAGSSECRRERRSARSRASLLAWGGVMTLAASGAVGALLVRVLPE